MGSFFNSTSLVPGGLLYGAGSTAMNPQTNGTMIGGLLNTLGAGLLAYGSGGDISEAVQRQGALNNQFINDRLQRAGMAQQIRQSGITNAINNAQTLSLLNWRNSKLGLPPVTLEQFSQNPDQYAQSMTQPLLPPRPVASPVPQQSGGLLPVQPGQQPGASPGALLPVGNAPTPSLSDFQPLSAGPGGRPLSPSISQAPAVTSLQAPVQQPLAPQPQTPQAQPALSEGGLTPEVAAMIQNDALFNKDYADMEFKLVTNGMPYIQAKALTESLAKDKQYMGPNGVTNLPGAVQAGAQVAGANAFATSQGNLPAQAALQTQRGQIERQNDVAKAGITPITIKIPDPQHPGQYIDFNTNNLTASRGSPGMPQPTPEQADVQKALADYKTKLTDAGNDAVQQNIDLQRMQDTMKEFRTSKLAPYEAAWRGWLNAAGLSTEEQDKALSSYQEFTKTAVKQATDRARQMGAREAASVVQMFVNSNPNATMTPQAIIDMTNANIAMNNYISAKSQAGDIYFQQNGTMTGFDTAWQQQHPPVAFLAPYLRPEQLTGELGKTALPYLSLQQLTDLRTKLSGGKAP